MYHSQVEIGKGKKNGERRHLDGEGKEKLKTTSAEKVKRRKTLKHRKRERKGENLVGAHLAVMWQVIGDSFFTILRGLACQDIAGGIACRVPVNG